MKHNIEQHVLIIYLVQQPQPQSQQKQKTNCPPNYTDNISFGVYNVQGQSLISKKVYKDGNNYRYELDMSEASPGVYLVRMGNNTIGYKVGKIVVK